jgi:biopolymer transport protein ExbD
VNIPSPRSRRRARIEIIPLIDVIFFLLATFMMVSLSMIKDRGIPVNLPGASSAAPQESRDAPAIGITADGSIHFDRVPVDLEGLVARLQQLRASVAEPKVVLRGDEGARYGVVIRVLDEVREQGITRVSIETGQRSAGDAREGAP